MPFDYLCLLILNIAIVECLRLGQLAGPDQHTPLEIGWVTYCCSLLSGATGAFASTDIEVVL
jgi:hypothetical protein